MQYIYRYIYHYINVYINVYIAIIEVFPQHLSVTKYKSRVTNYHQANTEQRIRPSLYDHHQVVRIHFISTFPVFCKHKAAVYATAACKCIISWAIKQSFIYLAVLCLIFKQLRWHVGKMVWI